MVVQGGTTCAKMLLVVFISILVLCGLLVLVSGFCLWLNMVVVDKDFFNTTYCDAMYILMWTGAFVTLLGILGSVGADRESTGMLAAYMLLLMAALAIEVSAVAMIFIHQDEVVTRLQNQYADAYLKLQEAQKASLKISQILRSLSPKLTLNSLHHRLDCCGMTDVVDEIVTDICPKQSKLGILRVRSCPSAITSIFHMNGSIILGECIGLCVVIILAMVLTEVLWAQIKKNRQQPEQCTQPIIMTTAWAYPQQQQQQHCTPLVIPTTPVEANPPCEEACPPYESDEESNKI
ncbi:CD9 antigen-like [Microcaecilia unicolor]|uniref:Tetraspanin n=1 Tax=Microcaecilia unicolor TaxID=1415580 RepID=A0A6P7XDE7_9AMPH|nr:CD9 antigen-like [Microcaecilia unicolor]